MIDTTSSLPGSLEAEAEGLGARRELRLAQGTVRYRERGSGRPLLFVHGLAVNGLHWRKVVPELAGRFRCIVPDWPLGAHSLPMAPDADLSPPGLGRLIADFAAGLGLEGTTLVGNDTGGALCQIAVTEHPGRFERLVLTDCDAYENFLPLAFRPLTWTARLPGGGRILAAGGRLRPLFRFLVGLLANTRPDDALIDAYTLPAARDAGVRRDYARFAGAIHRRFTLEAARRFARFPKPVLLVWAEDDRFFPLAFAERLARDFPDARLRVVRDSRAFVPEDRPEALAKEILEFLAPARPAPAPAGHTEGDPP